MAKHAVARGTSGAGGTPVRDTGTGIEVAHLKNVWPDRPALEFSEDETQIAVATTREDATAQIWDLQTGEMVRETRGRGPIARRGDGFTVVRRRRR